MDIDKDAVQDFVDAAVAWYEKESIFCNGVTVRTDDSHKMPLNECRQKGETDADSLNMGTALMPVKRKITRITNCEERKIINSFDGEAGSSKSISPREFAKELSNLSKSRFSHKNRVLLPDIPEYEEALRQEFGTTDRVGGDDGHPAYYFDQGLSPDTGFVVSNHIYVIQSPQGSEYRLLSDDLSAGELAADNSGNRLKMHIGDKGYSPIDVALWTKFTDPQDIRSGDLLELDLPDPDKVL
jgi:hypothetical protein